MLTITKNGKTKVVSESVFKSVFKDSGWSVVGEQSPTPVISDEQVGSNEEDVNEVVENNEDENVEDENNEDEIPDEVWDEAVAEEEVEKPLSDMSHDELVKKAKSLGIAKAEDMINKQLREAIKKKM